MNTICPDLDLYWSSFIWCKKDIEWSVWIFYSTHNDWLIDFLAEAFPIEFEREPEDIEVYIGDTTQLNCQVREEAHIEACRWYWQPVGHSQAWRVLMREFLPAGSDCSIQFANITADPEGLWVCHVKPIHSPKFIASKSAKLTVRGGNSTLLECKKYVFKQSS